MGDDGFFEDDNINVFEFIDDVKADNYSFRFVRGDDGKVVEYNAITDYDATHGRITEIFQKFISEIYGYKVNVGSHSQGQEYVVDYIDQDSNTCEGCSNPSCFVNKKDC